MVAGQRQRIDMPLEITPEAMRVLRIVQVRPGDVIAPDPPAAPTVSNVTSTAITLQLPETTAADHSRYELWRSSDGVNYLLAEPSLPVPIGSGGLMYVSAGLLPGVTYSFYLIDIDANNNRSEIGAVVSQQTSSVSNEPYDLTAGGTRTPPFTPVWPADPSITNSVTVTPGTLGANQVNGNVITLSPGSYGRINISGQDQEYIIQAGCTIDGVSVSGSGRRIKIRGLTPRIGSITDTITTSSECQDVLIDGVWQDAGSVASNNTHEGTRIAVINSRLLIGNLTTASFPNTGDTSPNHLILANNNMQSNGPSTNANRLQNVRNIIAVDNRISSNINGLAFRVHCPDRLGNGPTDNVWFEGNQVEGSRCWFLGVAESAGGDAGFGNLWFRNNECYFLTPQATYLTINGAANPIDDRPAYINLTGNNVYGSGVVQFIAPGDILPAYDIEGDNGVFGSATPPAWSFN